MSKIKELQTGKCKLLAVMVPEGAKGFEVDNDRVYYRGSFEGHEYVDFEAIPDGNWEIVGIDIELTEEWWREIVPQLGGKLFDGDLNNYYSYPDYLTIDHPFDNKQFNTAKESGLSLLEANQCYSVNPYGVEPPEYDVSKGDGSATRFLNWKKAESNVGRWFILKQL